MALDAGSVFTILGGKFNAAGFNEFDAANKRAVESATKAEAAQVASVGRLEGAHRRLASSARSVASAGARVSEAVPLKAMDAWAKQGDQASKNMAKLGQVATKTAGVGILAVAAATVYAAAKATTFNREMLKIATQAGGSAQEVAKLKTEVLGLAGQVPQGPQKLAEGLYHIQSAGFRGAQSMEMLKAAAMGAALGNADLQATTQAMIAATASQIKGVHGAADAMGQLNDIVGVGDMRMEQLAQAMATGLLPSAANAGLSLKDVGAALATVTDNATPANVTATRLRMTIALMASPSKAASKALEEVGLSSTSLATDMRQPNGLLKAVEDLKTHLRDSGKSAVEQDAILTKAFGGGRSSAVIQTLIAETDRLRTKYQQLGQSDGPSKLAKSWAEFQKSEAAGFGELKSGAEAFAITVGDVLMPALTKLAHGGAKALQGFISSGGAAKVGHDIEQAFSTVGQVFSNLAPPIEATAKALLDVGRAAGLGNATEISAILAGFLAFKAASFVAPILTAIAGAISEIGVAAATAGSLSAFGGDLVALAGGPVGALAIALGIAAAGFVAIKGGLLDSASAASENAAQMNADKAAIEGLNEAVKKTADSELEGKQAKLDQKQATEQLRQTEKLHREGKASTLQVEQAQLSAQRAGLRVQESTAATQKSLTEQRKKAEDSLTTAAGRREKIEDQIRKSEQRNLPGEQKERVKLQRELNDQLEKEAQANQRIAVAEVSRERLSHGKSAVSAQNAAGINQLQIALSGVPSTVRTKLLLEDQGTLAKLGQITSALEQMGQGTTAIKILTNAPSAAAALLGMRAILAGVPASKVIHILHNAPSAKAAMGQLHGAIDAVPGSKHVAISSNAAQVRSEIAGVQASIDGLSGKTIAIAVTKTFTAVENVVKRVTGHASGRPASSAETAWVGEGQGAEYVIDSKTGHGYKTDGPMLTGLDSSDYVVPLEDRYRGRALGLFAALARDLNVPGYKGGKHPKHHPIPNAIDPLSLPLSDIETKQQAAHSKYEHAASKVKGLESQVHTAERTLRYAGAKSRPKDSARLKELKGQLAKARGSHDYQAEHLKEQEWARTLKEAKDYQAKIDRQTQLVNIAGNEMKLADDHGNTAGYFAAKTKRGTALTALKELLAAARGHVRTGSPWFNELTEKIQGAELEAEGGASEEAPALTPDQVKEQKAIEARVAIAALTPGLADDTSAAQQLVSFFETALTQAQARGAGSEAIIELAGDVKNARSNLESLTSPGSGATNENADVQAQLTQERERREGAERTAQVAEGALNVFAGSGDIGAGGPNARAAVVQNIYTLHPGDPAVHRAVADSAAAGFSYQNGRPSPRVKVGP